MAHRYWRINITAVTVGTNVNMAEIQMAASTGGANLFGSGTPFASSAQGDTYAAGKACDGDVSTWWSTPDPGLGWWAYDFGSPVSVTEVRITALDYASVLYAPTAFTLDYSDDATTWTTVQSFAAAAYVAALPQSFDVTAPTEIAAVTTSKVNTYAAILPDQAAVAKLTTYLVVQPQIVRVPKITTYLVTLPSIQAASKFNTYVIGTIARFTIAMQDLVCYAPPAKDLSVILRYSDTKGASWGNPIYQTLGVEGGFDTDVSFRRLGQSRDRVWELSFTTTAPTNLIGAFILYVVSET